MVAQAKELELSGIAICDRDGLYGAARAFAAGREVKQRVIVGAELGLDPSAQRSGSWRGTASKRKPESDVSVLALLVETHQGYSNLCRLLTLAHADLPKGESSLELEWLSAHHQGLFALIPAPKRPGDASTPSAALLGQVREVFGERAALVAYRHLDGFDRERIITLRSWSQRYGVPIVASARPAYHHPTRKPLCDVMECIRRGTTLDKAGSELSANAEAMLRSELEMRRLFRDHQDWVDRAGEVAEGLHFSLAELCYHFPCSLEPGESADQKLVRLTLAGLRERYPAGTPESVTRQIDKELKLIAELGVAPYFLSVWEIVEIARRRRILCQGRGSAANSAVCYALGVTAVDPARSNLLFERFLSAERREPPDIDVDFEHERREEVIQEIYQRHGRECAAMVSEVICYRGKSALREVGKAFGLSLDQVDRLSGTIIHWDGAETGKKRLREMGFDPSDTRLQRVVELGQQLQGFPRHLSIHVGGFVLSSAPLCEVAPIEPGRMKDRTVVPWDKDDIETLGFFKIDVLGLGMLTAIRKALALIHEDGHLRSPVTAGEEAFDPLLVVTRIPAEDPAVYAMVSRADTVGVFQIESRAQMAMLPRLRPKCFYDLVIEVAIVRPGPIQGGMVHPYLRRRTGEEEARSPHPDLWPILKRTLGVPLFQEQVMQIAIEGAGYSGGEADQLRRDMAAWRKNGKLLRHRQRLLDGFARKGINPEFGAALFEQIKGFGDYGFPESHAASFALLVYSSAWQKAHFPEYFTCALLNSQPMGFYSPASLMRDAQRHGVTVRDVDVCSSFWDSSLEEALPAASAAARPRRALRLGMRLIKGLGESAAKRIEAARREWRFANMEDVIRRAELRKNEIEALAEAGAFSSLIDQRRQALWLGRAPRVQGLFAKSQWQEPRIELPALRPAEELVLDYRRKGLSVDDHPLCYLREKLKQRGVITAKELLTAPRGKQVSIAGLVLSRQQPGTASGVVFVTLEDETGIANLIIYSDVFERNHLAARHSSIMLVHGEVERPKGKQDPEYDVIHVVVRSLERLDVPGRDVAVVSRDFH